MRISLGLTQEQIGGNVGYWIPSLFHPTGHKDAPRPCQLNLLYEYMLRVLMIVCVHVGNVAVHVQGLYCINLHIWRTISQLKYTQDCE